MQLQNTICLGVAGNFAHHLEQAGELKDFENVVMSFFYSGVLIQPLNTCREGF